MCRCSVILFVGFLSVQVFLAPKLIYSDIKIRYWTSDFTFFSLFFYVLDVCLK